MSEIERLNKAIQLAPRVLLGDLIVQCDERNSDGLYTVNDVKGVSINKVIIETKADMTGVSLSPYKLFKHDEFCFVPITSRNGDRITLSINDHNRTYIVSSSYCVFKVAETSRLLPMFLYLYFCRPEFDRYARFNSWGSAREAFSFDDMRRVRFPLPPIEVQQRYVDAYVGLQKLAEENEALFEPLSKACQACLAKLKEKYSQVPLVDLIEPVLGQVNKDGFDYPFMGVNIAKQIVPTVANTSTVNPRKYVYIKNRQFVFSGMQTGRDECIRFTIYTGNTPVLLSPAYTILQVKDPNVVIPEYIFANFLSSEMDRLGWFYSDSSVRANLDLPRFLDIKIPLPPIEVQQSIVALHRCAEEARSIAAKARETLNSICPAMIQRATHEMH